jgi:hypothetical protein
MAGKAPATKYVEMRQVADGLSGGRTQLKKDIIPGFATWLIMLSKRYVAAANSMRHAHITRGIPGMLEAAQRMEFACEHLQWLMNELPCNFKRNAWLEAASEVAALLGIKEEAMPTWDISAGIFDYLIPPLDNATDTRTVGTTLQHSLAHGEGCETGGRGVDSGRPDGTGAASVGDGAAGRERDLLRRAIGRVPSDSGNRGGAEPSGEPARPKRAVKQGRGEKPRNRSKTG